MMDGDGKDRPDFVLATQWHYVMGAGNGVSLQ
jgi:hypothetical protein